MRNNSIYSLRTTKPRETGLLLLPYTTLFRSKHMGGELLNNVEQVIPVQMELVVNAEHHGAAMLRAGRFATVQTRSIGERTIDRKSTRLNSSHRTISYAVFCLKKKKEAVNGDR